MTELKCPSCGTAIHVPDKKTGLRWGIGCLIVAMGIPFTLVILGILAAIAIPAYVKARETAQMHACVNIMKTLEAAKEQAAQTHQYTEGSPVSEQEVSPYLPDGSFSALACPNGGFYTIHAVGHDPECSVHGTLSDAQDRKAR